MSAPIFKKTKVFALAFLFSLVCNCLFTFSVYGEKKLPTELGATESVELAVKAYIYAYPLISMDLTREVMTNVDKPSDKGAPLNQFYHQRAFTTPEITNAIAADPDTLFSFAWLNLSKEPYILHIPAMEKRYYALPILDAWTEVIATPGVRTSGGRAQDYVLVGPQWEKPLPKGMKKLRSETNIIWILGRIYSTGTMEDLEAVHKLQDQCTITPLSALAQPYVAEPGRVRLDIDTHTPIAAQIQAMDARHYFTRFARLMQINPPARMDEDLLKSIMPLGILQPDIAGISALTLKALQEAMTLGPIEMHAFENKAFMQKNGWLYSLSTGSYGTNYLQRAVTAAIGLGAILPEDQVNPITFVDAHGAPLNGNHSYRLHFTKETIPPVHAFWSVTAYNDKYLLTNNRVHRYGLGSFYPLHYNEDGSLDLYLQKNPPPSNRLSNWLPVPAQDFILIMRLYWPKKEVLNNLWSPPPVENLS